MEWWRGPAASSPVAAGEGTEDGSASEAGAEDIRAQLHRILRSPDFDVTERSRKFLTYVVEEAIAGRADRIKAYAIATDVFGRDASFDAHSDPVVRIEAGHLRRALNLYYVTGGMSDPLIISIPKGSYVPKFDARPTARMARPSVAPSLWPRAAAVVIASVLALALFTWLAVDWTRSAAVQTPALPRLTVMPFDDLTDVGNSKAIARGLTREIIGQLAKFKDIVTIEGDPQGAEAGSTPEGSRYILAGDVNMADNQFHVRARVLTRAENSVIWANSYEGDLQASKLIGIEAVIARQVATALGQPYGVIYQADASRRQDNAPDDWQAYACTLSYYAYRASLDAKTHPAVRKCLEDAVRRFPNYATAWALLSQTYVDEIRFRYPIEPSSSPASIDRALDAARRAVELDPENIRALQAEMFALFFHGEFAAALKVGEQAFRLNPNDTELVGEYGFRLALAGEWTRGCAMIEGARQRNPGPLAYYEAALALCSYFRGDFNEAEMWITKTPAPGNPNYHIIAAAIYGESGQTEKAAREREWLQAHVPKLLANLRPEIAIRVVRPEDVEHLMQSLRKAGIAPPSSESPISN
jgi:TolB-like protein